MLDIDCKVQAGGGIQGGAAGAGRADGRGVGNGLVAHPQAVTAHRIRVLLA